MNIREAKEQIKNTMKLYFLKDGEGKYRIPPERQRPVFLLGPPGIGKTAIMAQIAEELGVGLVSYSMTHHTRQSALGLPLIEHADYGNGDVPVTRYTMSEIIASVYDEMAETGKKQGILFLDEINCVSETLTPVMLQFLQYKTLGQHKVPDGWLIVTAGNPVEYNRNAKEFDIVTIDRLKRIDVEPDLQAFREYALKKFVHPSILTYLSIKKANFYFVRTTASGRRFVTARGWDDLSDIITLCEENDVPVDKRLIIQYLQDDDIAEDFAQYYALFSKYRSDYEVDMILEGKESVDIVKRATAASFDERIALISLLLGKCASGEKDIVRELDILKNKISSAAGEDDKAALKEQVKTLQEKAEAESEKLDNAFAFAEKAWEESQEKLIMVSELTANYWTARFIGRFGCEAYYRYSKDLLFAERHAEIRRELEEI